MRRVVRWILALVAVLLIAPGVYLCGAGVYLALIGPRQTEENYAQVRNAPAIVTVADLRGVAEGQRVLVSGRIADDSAGRSVPLKQGGSATFVAYDIYRYDTAHGPNGSTSITEVREAHITPSLTLQLPGGGMPVVNHDYYLARSRLLAVETAPESRGGATKTAGYPRAGRAISVTG